MMVPKPVVALVLLFPITDEVKNKEINKTRIKDKNETK